MIIALVEYSPKMKKKNQIINQGSSQGTIGPGRKIIYKREATCA